MKSFNMYFLILMLISGSFAYDARHYKVGDIITYKSFEPVYINTIHNITHKQPVRDIDISTIIAIGKEVWQIIKNGQPVVNYKIDWGGAIPKGANWSDLENFRTVKWGPFGWTFKNIYGIETVRFKWNFGFNCKGSYNGHGMFLTDVTTAVNEIYAAWGFTVNASAVVGQTPTNYGTKIDPIAGLPIEVTINVHTVLQHFTEKCSVVVKGDCTGAIISC